MEGGGAWKQSEHQTGSRSLKVLGLVNNHDPPLGLPALFYTTGLKGNPGTQGPGATWTPTSTHFLCSEGLASHVREHNPVLERDMDTATANSSISWSKTPLVTRPTAPQEAKLGRATPTSPPIGRSARHWR